MKKKRIVIVSIGCVLLVSLLSIVLLTVYKKKQLENLSTMTSSECISYTLKGNKDGRFAVALIKDNDVSFHMYTYDGIEDNKLDTSFEIGSITKTITASLIQKEILKGNLKLTNLKPSYRINATVIGVKLLKEMQNL